MFPTTGDLFFIDKGLLLDERVSILLYEQRLHMLRDVKECASGGIMEAGWLGPDKSLA